MIVNIQKKSSSIYIIYIHIYLRNSQISAYILPESSCLSELSYTPKSISVTYIVCALPFRNLLKVNSFIFYLIYHCLKAQTIISLHSIYIHRSLKSGVLLDQDWESQPLFFASAWLKRVACFVEFCYYARKYNNVDWWRYHEIVLLLSEHPLFVWFIDRRVFRLMTFYAWNLPWKFFLADISTFWKEKSFIMGKLWYFIL